MQTLSVVIAAIIIQVASAYSCTWRGVECIDYEVISNEAEYEERQYPETMWISVTSQARTLFEAKRRSFRKLIYYIQGFNDQNVTVDLTTPHRTLVTRGASGRRLANYTMAFPLPANLYMNPPQANDKDIYITVEPPRRYAVKSLSAPSWAESASPLPRVFGGQPNEQQWLRKAEEFIQVMRKDRRVNLDHFYVARYDLIFWVLERRNEIWLSMK
ncbi:heme-binding protein 2 [Rhipicephalus sanguineus]|uniref:heme-binding protein 2 n=1 Tax=Rhipicephalus sanguineus TaxID=34632 RepID=UPI0020C40AED|nr:heme-binding protein 2 [Rhipicephalus sanguineus]